MPLPFLPDILLPVDDIGDGIGGAPTIDPPPPPDFGGGPGPDGGGSGPGSGGDNGGSDAQLGQGLSEAEARQVAYLYEAGLDRDGNIDLPGLNFWIDQREAGLGQHDLASAFLGSREFEGAFGAPESLSDRELVERLYENVLDRSGEAGGVDFWTAELGRADFDRADLLLAFAASGENIAGSPEVATLTETSAGEWDFGG